MCKFKAFMISVALGCLLGACSREKSVGPIDDAGAAPGEVSNVQVTNIAGGAKISYTLPGDPDLFYVEADYEIRPGVKEQAKSSYYGNTLVVQGFRDTTAQKVTLYAVDRGEKRSGPVEVTINPLISPVRQAYASLAYDKDFGGISVTFENPSMADLVVDVMVKDSLGDWEDYDKNYSNLANGFFTVRGLPSQETTFGLYVKDRWDNHSDTLIKTLIPIFEVQLDKSLFKDMSAYLPGNPKPYSSSYTMPHLWDDNINSMYHTTQNVGDGAGFPLHFAFDLGVKAKLSRMRLWPRQGDWIYTHGNVKDMEVWGTNNDPGTWSPFSFAGWTKLADFHSFKPSGQPVGTNTEADNAYAVAGEEMPFPISDPPVRYIMFNVIDNWSQPPNDPSGFAHIAEVTFWGQPQP